MKIGIKTGERAEALSPNLRIESETRWTKDWVWALNQSI